MHHIFPVRAPGANDGLSPCPERAAGKATGSLVSVVAPGARNDRGDSVRADSSTEGPSRKGLR